MTPSEEALLFARLVRMLGADELGTIITDLLWKATRRDWHGVSDCANDLRELEAEARSRS